MLVVDRIVRFALHLIQPLLLGVTNWLLRYYFAYNLESLGSISLAKSSWNWLTVSISLTFNAIFLLFGENWKH